jgi:hypothetical protein
VDEASSVRLYVQALDKYIYYFEQALEAVSRPWRQSFPESSYLIYTVRIIGYPQIHKQSYGIDY